MKALRYVEIDVPLFLAHDRAIALGTTNYLVRGAGLTGASDNKTLTFSCWVRLDTLGTQQVILGSTTALGGATGKTRFLINSSNQFACAANNAGGSLILDLLSSPLTADVWHHIMCSVDMANPASRHLYVDGVSDMTVSTFTDDTIDHTAADWAVGNWPNGSDQLEGGLADVWFNNTYIDLSVEENRRKFISSAGNPVLLGAQGEYPTGSQPLVYMSGAEWSNLGSGGVFVPEEEIDLADDFPLQFIETFRFVQPSVYVPSSPSAIPSINSVETTPGTVSLGKDLGTRAVASISFVDHNHVFEDEPWTQGTFWSKWRGRYGMTLRGRELRVITGELDQEFESMTVETYMIDSSAGPSVNGEFSITAKDLLKFADDERSQAPVITDGKLAGSIDNDDTAATLTPAGIGNLQYPASGWVNLGGKEVASFTRVNDALTLTRAQFGSIAQSHAAGDRVQLVLRFAGNSVAEILRDLLEDYARIDSGYIPFADWELESDTYLNVLYARTITEPTAVKKLIEELIEQASLAVWWDPLAKKVQLKVLRQIDTSVTITEDQIIENTLQIAEQPDSRISQVWTFYGRRDPTQRTDQEDGFRAAQADVDLEKEEIYNNTPAIKKVMGNWIETVNAAQRLNGIQLSRYRDPPRRLAFTVWRDTLLELGVGYNLWWRKNTDARGLQIGSPIQIVRVRREHDFIHVEAEEMLASGVIVLTNTVFLTDTSGPLQWEVHASWNDADNSIHSIGAGGGGDAESGGGGGGGGGGAYASILNANLTPGGMVDYRVGVGATGANGGDSWFGNTVFASALVGAKGGSGATGVFGGDGGQAAASIGTTKFSGGDGGNGGLSNDGEGGGGGGGAAGPNGAGGHGGDGRGGDRPSRRGGGGGGAADGGQNGQTAVSSGGTGGNNRFGFGGGKGGSPSSGSGEAAGVGLQGGGGGGGGGNAHGGRESQGTQQWTQTISPIFAAGPAGGSGGAGEDFNATNGSDYGAGGGGSAEGVATRGGQGIIVIEWREAT